MTRVFSSPDAVLVDTFRRVLESYGVASDARAELPGGTRQRLPISALWVLDDAKADQARSIIAQAEKKGPGSAARWECSTCGSLIEGPFSDCWQCGTPRR